MGFRTNMRAAFSRTTAFSNKDFGQRFTSHSPSGSFGTISASAQARRPISVVAIAPPSASRVIIAGLSDVPRCFPGLDTPAAPPKYIQTWFPRFFVRKGRETLDQWCADGIPEITTRQIDYRVDRFRRAYGLNYDAADDLRQDFLVRVLDAIGDYDEARASPTTFAKSVIELFYCLCVRQHHKKRPTVCSLDALLLDERNGYHGPTTDAQDIDGVLDLRKVLDQLPDDQRELATAWVVRTATEIAETHGVTRGAIYRRFERLQEAVREVF